MSSALPGANFAVGAAIPGAANFNSRNAVNAFEAYRSFLREFSIIPYWAFDIATNVVSGSGGITKDGERIVGNTGVTHTSTAGAYGPVRLPGTASTFTINWDKKFFLFFTFYTIISDFTNITIRVPVTQATTIGNLAAHGLGLQTNGANINLATYGAGGAQQLVSAATNIVSQDRVAILIEHDPAVADRLYINGVLKATQSTAADIPSTSPAADYNLFPSIARAGGADTGDEKVIVENFFLAIKY